PDGLGERVFPRRQCRGDGMSDDRVIEGVPGPGRIGRVAPGDILHPTARRLPDHVALIEGERKTTYAELEALANRFAHHLRATLPAGAKVTSACNNSTEFVAVIFGILKAGMVWVPINTMLGVADAAYIAAHAGAALAVVDAEIHAVPERRALFADRGIPVVLVGAKGAPPAGAATFEESREGG